MSWYIYLWKKDRTGMIKEQVMTNRGEVFDAENNITGG